MGISAGEAADVAFFTAGSGPGNFPGTIVLGADRVLRARVLLAELAAIGSEAGATALEDELTGEVLFLNGWESELFEEEDAVGDVLAAALIGEVKAEFLPPIFEETGGIVCGELEIFVSGFAGFKIEAGFCFGWGTGGEDFTGR